MTREEKRKQYKKEWAANNKDKIKEYYKEWRAKNPVVKEERNAYMKEYRAKNPQRTKQYRDNQKDGYHRVYLLEDYNYVGVTNNIKQRFYLHKSQHNRDCTNHRVLYKTKSREDALELEELLHDIGYEGRNETKFIKTKII